MTANEGVTVINGRLHLTPELSAQLGIPNGIEFWRYNLLRATVDPSGYARVLGTMANEHLHRLLTLFDNLEIVARRHPGYIVPEHLNDDLHGILDRVRGDIRGEASRRGVSLVPWSATEGVQQ